MKKRLYFILYLCTAVLLAAAGCGSGAGTAGRTGSASAGVRDVLEAEMAKEDSRETAAEPQTLQTETQIQPPETAGESDGEPPETAGERTGDRKSGINADAPSPETQKEDEAALGGTEGIDIDLTAVSATMVYSEVYNMMVSPEAYIGKTVKMDGIYSYFHDEATGNDYFACIISDATACCSQGIEFVLTGAYAFPDDYPEDGEEICVTGVFDTYLEGQYTYCTLRDAVLCD